MGFDPRSWSSASATNRGHNVTSNVDALLAENEALRFEIQELKRQLALLLQHQQLHTQSNHPNSSDQPRHSVPKVTLVQVERWGEQLAIQKGWSLLRLRELEALIDSLNRKSFHSHLNLQDRLDHLVSGLGSDLFAAISRPITKKRCAVLASFALYGIRSCEWLDEDPQRVVHDLCNQLQIMRHNRRTRSDRRESDRYTSSYRSYQANADCTRSFALHVLGLEMGASQASIKNAYRRLVKQHHPDVGGTDDAFQQLNQAYQLLINE